MWNYSYINLLKCVFDQIVMDIDQDGVDVGAGLPSRLSMIRVHLNQSRQLAKLSISEFCCFAVLVSLKFEINRKLEKSDISSQ